MMSTNTIGMIFEGLLEMAVYYKYRSHFGSRYPLGLMRSAQASFLRVGVLSPLEGFAVRGSEAY